MKGKRDFSLTGLAAIVLVVALLAATGPTGAQSGAPTVVSYQGQVTVGGTPYDGTGYFKFAVVNAAGDTTYWSNDGTASGEPANAVQLTVSNGLFNVLLGDTSLANMTALPASAFDGTERYLRVWFSSDGSSFDLLSPDRRIAAVPYALQAEEARNAWALTGNAGTTAGTNFVGTTDNQALELKVNNIRVLRLEPGTSPNLIGGYSGNWITAGIFGATIDGGGQSGNLNRVTDHLGVIGGGQNNQAGNNDVDLGNAHFATIAGGWNNTASGESSMIGGGYNNTANGSYATVGGGAHNEATGYAATVSGGFDNTAQGNYSFAAGRRAQATLDGCFVWGDSTDADVTCTTANQFVARATGGMSLMVDTSGSGLRLEPNASSPNLIGGYSGNWLAAGTFGAVIAGGGQSGNLNRVVDHVGVVGGGQNNQAGSDNGNVGDNTLATVAGGANNTASGTLSAITGGSTNTASGYISTIAGGRSNVASGSYSTISGGWSNATSGNYTFVGGGYANLASAPVSGYGYSTVAGGYQNIASGDYSFIGAGANNQVTGGIYNAVVAGRLNLITTTNWANFIGGGYGNVITGTTGYATIGGGRQNRVTNSYATVAGGQANTASGSYATVAGGRGNTASGGYATVAGGWGNTASGYGSAVTGGFSASASHFGEQAHASGQFAAAGDAQASTYVLRREYAMAAGAWHDLFLDGNSASQRLTIAPGRTVTFDILISGRTSAGESAGYRIQGVIENVGGVTALVGTPIVTVLGEDDTAWNVQVLASDALDALLPQVQGNGETIRWVATVNTAEVSW
jgi:hypothetical protein